MRRKNAFAKSWLRTTLLIGCVQPTALFAQDNFIRQPKPVKTHAPIEPASPIVLNKPPSIVNTAVSNASPSESLSPNRSDSKIPRDADAVIKAVVPTKSSDIPASPFRKVTPQPIEVFDLNQAVKSDGHSRSQSAPKSTPRSGLQWVSKSSSTSNTGEQVSPNQSGLRTNSAQQQHAEIQPRALTALQTSNSVEANRDKGAKATVATLVSSKILNDPRFIANDEAQTQIASIETPNGWQSVGQQLSARMANCERMLSRGAYFSAREEAEAGILILIRHLDLIGGSYSCEPAWSAANQALREAEEFVVAQHTVTTADSLKRLIDSHETPLLKGANLAGVSPAIAAQHYCLLAEKLLSEASQGHPWASELYYAIGRTFQAEADQNKDQQSSLRANALCYYRVSRTTLPSNAVACNQLGFLLLQLDRPGEAREAIAAALSNRLDETFLSNLAEASRRLGDNATVQWANQTIADRRGGNSDEQNAPQIVELSPAEFAALSPYAASPQQSEPSPAPTLPSARPNKTANIPTSSSLR